MIRLYFLLFIGILSISTASILIKLCDAPSLIIATYRLSLASLLLLPFASIKKIWQNWKGFEWRWLVLSGLFLALHFAFWIASLKFTSVSSSVTLVSTHPIFVGLGALLFFKEPLGWNLVWGIILTVFGCGLIGSADALISKGRLAGDGLALIGALMASGYLLVGRRLRKEKDLLSYIFPVYSISGLTLIFLSLLFQKSFFGYSINTYLWMVLLALIPQLIGHTTFNWALKYLPTSMVAITILGEPVGSTLLASLILGERLTIMKILGGVFILCGILVALIPHSIRRGNEERELK